MLSELTKKRVDLIVKVAYYAVLILLGFLALYLLRIILPFVLAVGLAMAMRPVVRFVHRKFNLSQNVSSIVVMLLLYAVMGVILGWLAVRTVFFLRDFFAMFPDYFDENIAPRIADFEAWLGGDTLGELQVILFDGFHGIVASVSQWGFDVMSSFVVAVPTFIFTLALTIMMSFFVGIEYDSVMKFFRRQLPERAMEFLGRLRKLATNTFGRYVKAYLVIMAITFVELMIGFVIIGVPNPIGAAAAIALFDFLPVYGAGTVILIWTIIELLLGNVSYAIGLGIIGIVVSVVRYIIEPKILGSRLGISPIAVLLSILIGFRVFGVVGLIFAPMVVQILVVLHNNGAIRIWKTEAQEKEEKRGMKESESPKEEKNGE